MDNIPNDRVVIYRPNEPSIMYERKTPYTFEEGYKEIGNGCDMIQMVELKIAGQMCQCLCDEDGLMKTIQIMNPAVTELLLNKVFLPPRGALGTWIFLFGRARCR